MIKSPVYPGAGSHVQNTVPVIVKKKANNRKPKNKNPNVPMPVHQVPVVVDVHQPPGSLQGLKSASVVVDSFPRSAVSGPVSSSSVDLAWENKTKNEIDMFHKHLIYEQQVTNSLIREHTPKPFVTHKSTRNQSLFEKVSQEGFKRTTTGTPIAHANH